MASSPSPLPVVSMASRDFLMDQVTKYIKAQSFPQFLADSFLDDTEQYVMKSNMAQVPVSFLGQTAVGKSCSINLLLLPYSPYSPDATEPYVPQDKRDKLEVMEDRDALACWVESKPGTPEALRDLNHLSAWPSIKEKCRPKVLGKKFKQRHQEDMELFHTQLKDCYEMLQERAKGQPHTAPDGNKLTFLLPTQNSIDKSSTTGFNIHVRYGRVVHVMAAFLTESELRSKLTSLITKEYPGVARLLNKLCVNKYTENTLPETALDVEFTAEVKKILGDFQIYRGKGVNFVDDVFFVRSQLKRWNLSDPHSMLMKKCLVFVPSTLLTTGIELIDVPGCNDTNQVKNLQMETALEDNHYAVMMLKSALSASEREISILIDSGFMDRLMKGEEESHLFVMLNRENNTAGSYNLEQMEQLHSSVEENIALLKEELIQGGFTERYSEEHIDAALRKRVTFSNVAPALACSMLIQSKAEDISKEVTAEHLQITGVYGFLAKLYNIQQKMCQENMAGLGGISEHHLQLLITRTSMSDDEILEEARQMAEGLISESGEMTTKMILEKERREQDMVKLIDEAVRSGMRAVTERDLFIWEVFNLKSPERSAARTTAAEQLEKIFKYELERRSPELKRIFRIRPVTTVRIFGSGMGQIYFGGMTSCYRELLQKAKNKVTEVLADTITKSVIPIYSNMLHDVFPSIKQSPAGEAHTKEFLRMQQQNVRMTICYHMDRVLMKNKVNTIRVLFEETLNNHLREAATQKLETTWLRDREQIIEQIYQVQKDTLDKLIKSLVSDTESAVRPILLKILNFSSRTSTETRLGDSVLLEFTKLLKPMNDIAGVELIKETLENLSASLAPKTAAPVKPIPVKKKTTKKNAAIPAIQMSSIQDSDEEEESSSPPKSGKTKKKKPQSDDSQQTEVGESPKKRGTKRARSSTKDSSRPSKKARKE